MTDRERIVKAQRVGFETGLSFARAIQDAGGRIPTRAELSGMSVVEFISAIAAQNGIRFHYDPQRSVPPTTPETDVVVVFGDDPKDPDSQ